MPKLPVSDEQIERLRTTKRTWFIHPRMARLALRVSEPNDTYPQGRKSWYLVNPQFRFGAFPAIKLKSAVEMAGQLMAKSTLGTDLKVERDNERAKRGARAGGQTLADIADLFVKGHFKSLRDTTRVEWERYLEKDIVPEWGTRVMEPSLWKKREVKAWLAEVMDKRGPWVANDIYTCMRRLFSWASEEEHIGEWTPFLNLDRPASRNSRDRVLSMAEVKKILVWLKTEPIVFRAAWMTFFWTLARRRPVSNMTFSELDLDSAKWTFYDKGRGKGKHRVAPLPSQAIKCYGLLREVNPAADYVFSTGYAKRNSSFEKLSYRYQLSLQPSLDRARVATGIEDFKGAHDIRRTMATRLAEEGFADENLIARILGHGLPGVEPHTLIYQRYARLNEQRDALQKLADWLDLVANEKLALIGRPKAG